MDVLVIHIVLNDDYAKSSTTIITAIYLNKENQMRGSHSMHGRDEKRMQNFSRR